jgi:hypothetical protein
MNRHERRQLVRRTITVWYLFSLVGGLELSLRGGVLCPGVASLVQQCSCAFRARNRHQTSGKTMLDMVGPVTVSFI